MTHFKSKKAKQAYAKKNLSVLGKTATHKVYRLVEKAVEAKKK